MRVPCAWAAKRSKDSYYRAQFYRLQARRGPQKAICAVAASILTAIYHILEDGVPHQDLGVDYFDKRKPEGTVKRLVAQIAKLGFQATPQGSARSRALAQSPHRGRAIAGSLPRSKPSSWRARPPLELLLGRDRFIHAFIGFLEHQRLAAVAARETLAEAFPMLVDALRQVRPDTGACRGRQPEPQPDA